MKFIVSTDGGAFKKEGGGFDAVSAFRIYEGDKLLYKEGILLEDKTSNFAEIFAIFRGIRAISSYIIHSGIKKAEVYIITDSELCYKSLNTWFDTWLEKSESTILLNSSGKPVINQEVIKMAYIHMLRLQKYCDLKLCHINSHESINDIEKVRKKFNKTNKLKINEDDFKIIFMSNHETDKMIKCIYDKRTKEKGE